MASERTRVQIGLIAAIAVFVLCMALIISGAMRRGDLNEGLKGSLAPDFSLRDADNRPVRLSELRGNVVVVYFGGHTPDSAESSATPPATAPSGSATANSGTADSVTTDSGTAVADQSTVNHSSSVNDSSATLASASTPAAANAGRANSGAGISDIQQVTELCREKHVKFLNLQTPSLLHPDEASAIDENGIVLNSNDGTIDTLFDTTGDVARRFKIDRENGKPTFFVIDPSGVIRYRGDTVSEAAAEAMRAPATQPSSGQQMAQSLLSGEALNLPGVNGHL
jgi:cytochrome oxidase Cu insertion factor (SCO1/SenC/PrrC family)